MSRIAARFEALRARARTALVPYITAGDPEPDKTVAMMHAMTAAGADVLELGVPFSDPMADGPVIQAACERALRHRIGLRDVLAMVAQFRRDDADTPVVLMGYLNPIESMGYAAFAEAVAQAQVDGVLTVDLPPEEATPWVATLGTVAVDPIFLLAPTTTHARMQTICRVASGFVYYVSLKGVTGAASLDIDAVEAKLAELRSVTKLPVGVGFGIQDAATAARMARIADAVVVGSALVRRIGEHADDAEACQREVTTLLHAMRTAMDERSSGEQVA